MLTVNYKHKHETIKPKKKKNENKLFKILRKINYIKYL